MASRPQMGLTKISEDRIETRKMAGEYEELLCNNCESRLSIFDDYGTKFLRGKIGKKLDNLGGRGIPPGVEILRGIDIAKLRMFIVSVLWRASVSSRDFYSQVNLGSFESEAKDILLRNTMEPGDFPFLITRYSEIDRAKDIISNPTLSPQNGIDLYCLNMRGFNFWIKVDKKELTEPQGAIWYWLLAKSYVLIMEKDFIGSPEFWVTAQLWNKFNRPQ